MVKGYKNKNRERERERAQQLLSECAGRSRSQEWWSKTKWERLAARCRQRDASRDAGRARNRLGRSLSSDAQVEFAAEAEAEQRESKSMWSGCSCCSPTDPARQSLSFSLALSLVLSAARVRPVSLCLAAVKPHAPKPMTKLYVWFIFVAFCVQVLFVFFIIYHYFLPASSFTDPHTDTQTGLPCYAVSCLDYTAHNQAQLFQFVFAHARMKETKINKQIENNQVGSRRRAGAL